MSFPAKRQRSRDKGDGTIALGFDCEPKDVPDHLRYAVAKTAFALSIRDGEGGESVDLFALKLANVDRGGGRVGIAFLATATDVPDWLAFGRRESAEVRIAANPAPDHDDRMFPGDAEDRIRIMRKLCIFPKDRSFADWLKPMDPANLIAQIQEDPYGDVEAAVVEVVLRIIGANSRADVKSNAIVASKADGLMRSYRSSLSSRA